MTASSTTSGRLPLVVSLNEPEPMYRQIENQLRGLILGGRLPPETRLPSVRALASDLACSVITTRRAYQELENEGFIRTRQGMGTVVAELSEHTVRTFRQQRVTHAFRDVIREGLHAGLTDAELRQLFEATMASFLTGDQEGGSDV